MLLTQGLSAADDGAVDETADDAVKRPNVLFAFADDWGRHASAYAGHPLTPDGGGDVLCEVVATPNFDAVAARGLLYTRAFVNSPSCTPCRSSLLTGRHFWQTGRGAILSGAVWDHTIPTWPERLAEAGYRIGCTHKVWSPGKPFNAAFDDNRRQFDSAGSIDKRFSQYATGRIEAGVSFDQVRREVAEVVRGNFATFLDEPDRDPSAPFVYFYGPTNVHRKWVAGSGSRLWGLDPERLQGRLPSFLPDHATVRQDLVDYLGEAQAFDAAVGTLLDEVERRGLTDDTLIVISGDHGPAGFPHGKCNLYDFGTAVPLAIAGPGVDSGRVVERVVSLPALAPTLVRAGGGIPLGDLPHRELPEVFGSERGDFDATEPDAVFFGRERHVDVARAGYLPYPQRGIRTADHAFIINFAPDRYPLGDPDRLDGDAEPKFAELANDTMVTLPDEDQGPTKAFLVTRRHQSDVEPIYRHAYGKRPREEFYDLRHDPDQMTNLAVDRDVRPIVDRLRRRLLDEMERTGDPRLIDDGRFFETPPMAGRTGKRRRPEDRS